MLYNISIFTDARYSFDAEVLGGKGTGLIVNAPFSVLVACRSNGIPSAIGFVMCARVGGITLALATANTIFLKLSQNEIHRIISTASQAEVQAPINGVGSTLLDNPTPEVRT